MQFGYYTLIVHSWFALHTHTLARTHCVFVCVCSVIIVMPLRGFTSIMKTPVFQILRMQVSRYSELLSNDVTLCIKCPFPILYYQVNDKCNKTAHAFVLSTRLWFIPDFYSSLNLVVLFCAALKVSSWSTLFSGKFALMAHFPIQSVVISTSTFNYC